MRIYTIGFTQHSAEDFFEKLKSNQVKRVIDIRINRTSQLAGFAKAKDLPYFLRLMGGIDYLAIPDLAPSRQLLKSYRSQEISWEVFKESYLSQIVATKATEELNSDKFDQACLLCSEHSTEKCHRRLLVELLSERWKAEVIHL